MRRIGLMVMVMLAATMPAQQSKQQILDEFTAFLAIPNLASDTPNINRNAEAIVAMFGRRNIEAKLLRIEGAPPLVVADLPAPGAVRTVNYYAHYDGQPVDEKQWTSPPWKPVIRGDRIYARSAGDDKGAIMAMLAAVDAMRAAGKRPSVNLKFVFEGEEEAGSPHLAAYLEKYADALRGDVWMLCDGPVHQSRRPQLFFGARGITELELTTYGPIKGLHDGHYGNWVPNPIVMLTHLLDSMRDDNGRILIDRFYDDVVRTEVHDIPPVENELKKEFAIGRTEAESLFDSILLPALNVRGISSGRIGAQASNTINTEATASIDFRLVPNETPQSVRALVEEHIARQGYFIVHDTPDAATRSAHARVARLVWNTSGGYPPARTSPDLPVSREVIDIVTKAIGKPVVLPSLGGSIPMYLFKGNVIGLPIANHDDNQHASDENLRLQNLWDGITIFEALFSGMRTNEGFSPPPAAGLHDE